VILKGRDTPFHRYALSIALVVGAPAAVLQPLSGDVSARAVAAWQPTKLAALEGQFTTERGAPLRIGGIPDAAARQTRFAIEIPRGLSFLAFHDFNAEVRGLDAVPPELWPPILPVHFGFQLMVALGSIMATVSLIVLIFKIRNIPVFDKRWLLRALAIIAPFGFIATEAGWTVTEVGRQPWTVQGILRTADAVTPMPGLIVPMLLFALLYLGLGAIVVYLIAAIVKETT
jgi:cytochrome d ubiquinol oxidase subunit I